jgi:hypothetical protein
MRRALSAAGTGLTVPLHNFIESYIVRTEGAGGLEQFICRCPVDTCLRPAGRAQHNNFLESLSSTPIFWQSCLTSLTEGNI